MSHSPSTAHPEHSSCVAHRVPDDPEGFDPICQFPAATSHHQTPPGKSRQCTMPDAVRAYQGASARRDSAARSDDASECARAPIADATGLGSACAMSRSGRHAWCWPMGPRSIQVQRTPERPATRRKSVPRSPRPCRKYASRGGTYVPKRPSRTALLRPAAWRKRATRSCTAPGADRAAANARRPASTTTASPASSGRSN